MGQRIQPPEFIQIPRQALVDKDLQPTDRILLGYIYWFTRLKNERCTAGNPVLADLVGTTGRNIARSLDRLETGGYVFRVFKDDSRRVRIEIQCLIAFSKQVRPNGHTQPYVRPNGHTVRPNGHTSQQGYVRPNGHPNKNKEEKVKRRESNNSKGTGSGLQPIEPSTSRSDGSKHVNGSSGYLAAKKAVHKLRMRQEGHLVAGLVAVLNE